MLYCKGALETVLRCATACQLDGQEVPLDARRE